MALRLKKLDDVKVYNYDADVWQQGNIITVSLPLEQIDPMYSNVIHKAYDNNSNITMADVIKSFKEDVDRLKSCAHVFEATVIGGRQTNKCKHCLAEIK